MELHIQKIKFTLMVISLILFGLVDNPSSILADGILVLTLTSVALIDHKQGNKFTFYIWSGLSCLMTFCFVLKAFIL